MTEYLLPERRGILKRWEPQAGEAIAARQAAVREALAKARCTNLLNLRKLRKKAKGVLDQRTIQTALGKCPPLQ